MCPRRGDCGGLEGPGKNLEGTWGEGKGGRIFINLSIFINSFRNLCYFSKKQGHMKNPELGLKSGLFVYKSSTFYYRNDQQAALVDMGLG